MAERPQSVVSFLIIANKLCLKAFSASNQASLKFIILNDTINIIHYDRAYLWDLTASPELIGISGQATTKKNEHVRQWGQLIAQIEDKSRSQEISILDTDKYPDLKDSMGSKLYWFPFKFEDKTMYGLLLQSWSQNQQGMTFSAESINYMQDFVIPAYAASWHKINQKFSLKKYVSDRKKIITLFTILFFLSFFIKLPLRIVAPCEIVPENPYLITAPIEGIIQEINVKPGELVRKGQQLVEYDNRIPLQDYRISQKQVEVLQAEISKTLAQGLKDPAKYQEISVINLKLAKEKLSSDLAKYQLDRSTIAAPIEGLAVFDNPDQWRGKPVKIGEKIMLLTNPHKTKLKIWLPEADNLPFNKKEPLKIILNIDPQQTYYASIIYISNEVSVYKNIPSFQAEALWIEKQPPVAKLGLQGTAIIYGEKVSIYYYFLRKPYATLRRILGY